MMSPEDDAKGKRPPLLRYKSHHLASVFIPEALLREARRQKGIGAEAVPDICVLDPDGDIVRHLVATNCTRRLTSWACYHTDLFAFEREGVKYGIVGCAVGAEWTTDAPFPETAEAIAAAKDAGILAVEMEAAALYAFAAARNQPVPCFAHVTNQMGRVEGDFEKGVADGAAESLDVIAQVACCWRSRSPPAALKKSSTLKPAVATRPPLTPEVSP